MAFQTGGNPLLEEFLKLASPGSAITPESLPEPIGEQDAFIIIDMQNDFVPFHPELNPFGGKFGVAEGQAVVGPIAWLVREAVKRKATVVASRDYHTGDHVSFLTEKGPFPVHCVQGTRGAHIVAPIAEALAQGMNVLGTEKVRIGFKAFHEDVDSFGGLPYANGAVYAEGGKGRVSQREPGGVDTCHACPISVGCTASPWTGCMILKQSAMIGPLREHQVCADDLNSPPDVLAISKDRERGAMPLQDALKGCKRLFVCGLALDYCVGDTCINAKALGFPEVYMIMDLARSAYIPGLGSFGTGFLQNPEEVYGNLKKAGVKVTSLQNAAGSLPPASVAVGVSVQAEFPSRLGGLGLTDTGLKISVASGTYSIDLEIELEPLVQLGCHLKGKCGPINAIPNGWPSAVESGATQFCWAHPLDGIAEKANASDSRAKIAFVGITACPKLLFATYGGFLLLGSNSQVLCAQAHSSGETLQFFGPSEAPAEVAQVLREQGRLRDVQIPTLKRGGATLVSYIMPGEQVQYGQRQPWKPNVPHGAFLYILADPGAKPIFFALKHPGGTVASRVRSTVMGIFSGFGKEA